MATARKHRRRKILKPSQRNAPARTETEIHDRERSLAALGRARREEVSVAAAAKKEGITVRMMRRYVGSALRQSRPGGPYRATASDRLTRHMHMLTNQGAEPVTVRSSRTATRISEHANAIGAARKTRDWSGLLTFKNQSVRVGGVRYRFLTDSASIQRLEDADELQMLDGIYVSIGGSR